MDLTPLIQPADTKILLIVMDGLGGYADGDHGTELEEAATPHLDQLAAEGVSGLVEPVGPGITPGSGPGHLGLFGYHPERFELGRGALSAAGLDFELRPGDVAARGNLCSLDAEGRITDRRAGRVPDDEARDRRPAAERGAPRWRRRVLPARTRAPGARGATGGRARPPARRYRSAAHG